MPIIHILDVPLQCLVKHCAACGAVQSVPLDSLKLGTESDRNLIELPGCACGAQEYLNRTFDSAPEELADHRKKVNALAVALRSSGRVHPKHADAVRAETAAPAQVGDLVGPVAPIVGLPSVVVPPGLKLPS